MMKRSYEPFSCIALALIRADSGAATSAAKDAWPANASAKTAANAFNLKAFVFKATSPQERQ
jgi:hypothetical protein